MTVGGTDWLYAIGDVNGRALLTHQASYQARVAAAVIAARSRGEQPTMSAEADAQNVPQVIFTDPEVAAVGLTRRAAAQDGVRVRYAEVDLGAVLGARLHAKGYTGRASLLVDDDTDVVVGAAFVGQDVADMLHAATVAIVGQVPLRRLHHAVPSFPTMSEVWLDLLNAAGSAASS
jgi:dihydrolipoamide dehydrogenase